MMAELKPCPVCDGIHGIDSFEDHFDKGYAVSNLATKEESIEAWNRRAEDDKR